MVKDEKANRSTKRFVVAAREQCEAPIELVEHARADFGVTKKVDRAVGGNGPRLDFADVMKERRPANLQARLRLAHDLLRVLPDVFVPPLAVTETDERVNLGEDNGQASGLRERVEAVFGTVTDDHAVEGTAHAKAIKLDGGAHVLDARKVDERSLPTLGPLRRVLESVEGPVSFRRFLGLDGHARHRARLSRRRMKRQATRAVLMR